MLLPRVQSNYNYPELSRNYRSFVSSFLFKGLREHKERYNRVRNVCMAKTERL